MIKIRFIFILVSTLGCLLGNSQNAIPSWQPASYKIVGSNYQTFTTTQYAHVFSGSKHNVVRLAPELKGLTGVKLPYKTDNSLKLKFNQPVKVIIGVFKDENSNIKDNKNAQLVLQNGLTISGLSFVDVYAMPYSKGTHAINTSGLCTVLGVIKANEILNFRNAECPDGNLWNPTFVIEGFSDEKPLFEIIGGQNSPVVDEGMPGTEGIQGGFEGGRVVKVGDTYHMFPTERA